MKVYLLESFKVFWDL